MLLLVVLLSLNVIPGEAFPSYGHLDEDQLAAEELQVRNASACEPCVPELCPPAPGCRAGLVRDSCGCCLECGNLEGQTCDPGDTNVHYGLCGHGLECRSDTGEPQEPQEPQCVCASQEPLCGSDARTYMNLCKFRDAAFSKPGLSSRHGPCKSVPVIKVPPRNLVNVTGSSAVFLCEVFAFPMALVEWRKEGKEVVLPGDDPHISVQVTLLHVLTQLGFVLYMRYVGKYATVLPPEDNRTSLTNTNTETQGFIHTTQQSAKQETPDYNDRTGHKTHDKTHITSA